MNCAKLMTSSKKYIIKKAFSSNIRITKANSLHVTMKPAVLTWNNEAQKSPCRKSIKQSKDQLVKLLLNRKFPVSQHKGSDNWCVHPPAYEQSDSDIFFVVLALMKGPETMEFQQHFTVYFKLGKRPVSLVVLLFGESSSRNCFKTKGAKGI